MTRRMGAWFGLAVAVSIVSLAWAQPSAPSPRTIPDVPKIGPVVKVEIHDEIEPGLAEFVSRVLHEHGDGELVLVDLNTLGGRIDSALKIRDALLETKATSVCWVHPRAISAGALITLACDVVVMTPDGSMGAATPVQVSLSGTMSPVDKKVTSYMRQEMAQTARMQKRDPLIAEAMVDADVEVPGLSPRGQLLTLDTESALKWHIADYRAANEAELWQVLDRDVPRVELQRPTGAELLARFLSNPMVAALLMILGLLGIAVEVFHPTHGAALVFGLMCLGLFFFGNHMVELAGWTEVAIVAVGLLLIAAEYAFPGHAVFGVVGLHLVLVGLFLGLVSFDRLPVPVAWETGILPRALTSVSAAFLATLTMAVLWLRYGPRTRFGKALVLDAVVPMPEGPSRGIGLEALVGSTGVALTDLRPVGRVEVINKRVEARVERGFVSAGDRVMVIRIEGSRVIVREVQEALPEGDTGSASSF